MLDEGTNNNLETPEAPPPEESNNRTFLIVGGIFAALIFLTLVGAAIFVLGPLASRTASQRASQTAIVAGNAQVVMQMTSTAKAALWTPTLPPTVAPTDTNTPVPTVAPVNSPTPVIAAPATPATATPTTDPGTLVAMQTQLSAQMTSTAVSALVTTPGTPGAFVTPAHKMPKTGFFDQVGLPSLVILTLALLVVIFMARRLRNAPSK